MKKSGENEIKLGLKNKYYGHYGFYDKDGYLNIRFRKNNGYKKFDYCYRPRTRNE